MTTLFCIVREGNWEEFYGTRKEFREAFDGYIAMGEEPDTRFVEYDLTRKGVADLCNRLKQDGD
jgi:hypothetical protein